MSEQATAAVGTDAAKTGHVKLSWREKICYGFGDFGNGFMFDLGQAYLTKYWIDVCTIPAGAVAGIFAFTKIFDAFMDPIAGSAIDSRKNIGPRGKFRPVMMISRKSSSPTALTWPGAWSIPLRISPTRLWPAS